jgi:hypothetical protein
MWISRLVCRVSRRSSNEVCRHEKSNKNRKKRETNMSRVCLKEVQATIAFACVDSQSLIQRRASLSEAAIKRCHSSMYNGDDKNGARFEHSSNAGLEQVQNTVHFSASTPASAVNSL